MDSVPCISHGAHKTTYLSIDCSAVLNIIIIRHAEEIELWRIKFYHGHTCTILSNQMVVTKSLVDLPDKDSMELHLPGPVLGLVEDLGRVGTVLVKMEQVAVQDLLLGTVAGKEVEVEGIYSAVAGCSYSRLGTDTVIVGRYLP